ncbi:MAG: ThuA domain-containing protein [Planctomycetota bacterium]|jgi:trehalose utilization protein
MTTISTVFLALLMPVMAARKPKAVQVVVWDERQPKQQQMYENFLGNHIADYLRKQEGFSVRSVGMGDPQQGLADELLDNCDVLIWWGHQRQGEISEETARRIVDRVKAGKLSLLVLHSAHWSTPFMVGMHERAKQDVLAKLAPSQRARVKFEWVGKLERKAPAPDAELTPRISYEKVEDGTTIVGITRPNCCFPYYKAHGKPSRVKTLLPEHPIAAGVPAEFTIPQTEMYGEPFHVPAPDAVIFEERWEDGKWFRAGMLWKVGEGKIFYFRPGHENFSVYLQPNVLKIIENTSQYLAKGK